MTQEAKVMMVVATRITLMAATRNQSTKSPGKLVWDPAGTPLAIYSSTGWTCELQETVVNLNSTRWGAHNQIMTARLVRIEGQPTQFTALALAKLYSHGAVRKGGSIIGSTDKVLELHTDDGKKRTFPCAFVYQEPAMNCMAGKTIMGNVVIYAIFGLNGDSADIDDLYDEGTVTWSDADWDQDAEITPGWNFSWPTGSASAWDDIDTKEPGVLVTPKSRLVEDISTRDGLRNVTLSDYHVEVSAQVMNISETLVLDAAGRTLKPGQSKLALKRDLLLESTDGTAWIRVYGGLLQPGYKFQFDADNHVVSSLTWRSFPSQEGGVMSPHLLVTTTDPDA